MSMFRIRRAQHEPDPDPAEPHAPGPSGQSGDRRTHSAHHVRRALVLVAVGSLAAAAITLLSTVSEEEGSSGDSAPAAAAPTSSVDGAAFAQAQPGDYLTWSNPVKPDLTKADCEADHLFEVSATVDLSVFPNSEFGPSAALATPDRYSELRDQVCVPATERYLDGKLDPNGRFTVGLIHPSAEGWSQGERSVRCGIQETSVDGTVFRTISGAVASQDQSKVHAPGTCLGFKDNLPADPVDCAEEHAVEATAVLNLAEQFPGGPPSAEDQDAFLRDACVAASGDFLGSADAVRNQTLTVYWDTVRLPGWLAGSRLVNCTVGSPAKTGGFAPIVGGARGAITIDGKAPAPEPAPPPGRSAPVPLTSPATPPAADGPAPGADSPQDPGADADADAGA